MPGSIRKRQQLSDNPDAMMQSSIRGGSFITEAGGALRPLFG
jgi:hypothetical protein